MIKAVLLDLDNTLLKNPDEPFARAYLGLANHFFQKLWQYPNFGDVLLQGLRSLSQNRDHTLSNAAVMLRHIESVTGRSQAEITAALSEFYRICYPDLASLISPVDSAAPLINELLEKKYAVVIATNPIYPAEAIQQRLKWAGLPEDLSCYALVTHADNMHFIKPDPAYYSEIVARIGVEPDEAVMVGDNPRNDITPAQTAGLQTYLVDGTEDETTFSGTLDTFYDYAVSGTWLEQLIPRPIESTMIEPEMRGNVGALFGTLTEVKPHYWHQHPDPEEWSLIQTVCHLLESEIKVQRWRLQKIKAENNPFLSNPLPPPGPRDAIPCADNGWDAARRFAKERKLTIEWLQTLQPEDWSRPARHSVFGPTTLLEMAHFTAQHDRLHINQICQTLGKCV